MGGTSCCGCEGDPPNEYQHALMQQEAKYSFSSKSQNAFKRTYNDCNFHTKSLCDYANRLIELLYNYRIFMSRDLESKSYQISNYRLSNLETDFNHMINMHINNKIFMTNFIEALSTKNNYKKCNRNKCHSYQRMKTSNYYQLKSIQDIKFINKLDHIHKNLVYYVLFAFQLKSGRN